MKNYQHLLYQVLSHGDMRKDRTGVGTLALFGTHLRFDLTKGFPAVTTKKLFFESVKAELAWFLQGTRSVKPLHEYNCHIWDKNIQNSKWQEEPLCFDGDDAGRVYGVQWRRWRMYEGDHLDQLQGCINTIIQNPTCRRMIVTAWNPGDLDEMCLPPCHLYYQFFVRDGKFLDIGVVMRSVDTFLGMPFDIASYALLCHIVARQTGLKPGELYMSFMDTHIYLNHQDQVREQLERKPYQHPQLDWNVPYVSIDNFQPHMCKLINYNHHDAIKAEMNDA